MNKTVCFILGIVTGVILTFVGLFVIGLVNQKSGENDPVKYLEKPVSYENKSETSFSVFQVFENAALATEESGRFGEKVFFDGNTVMILGEDFYSDQVVKIKNPMRVGTFSYTNKGGMPMTVPVVDGEME